MVRESSAHPSPIPIPIWESPPWSRISPRARPGVWAGTKLQQLLRQLVFCLSGKTHHLILPSGTQQLPAPPRLSLVSVPNPSLSKHPPSSTSPDPVLLLGAGSAPHSVPQGPPQLHLQPPRKTQHTSKQPNPQTSVPSIYSGEGCQDDTANKNNPNHFQRTLSPPLNYRESHLRLKFMH